MSILGSLLSIVSVFRKVADMAYSFFKWRTSRCRKLMRKIELVDRDLSMALREGRVTDANILAEERRKLYEAYRGCGDVEVSEDYE